MPISYITPFSSLTHSKSLALNERSLVEFYDRTESPEFKKKVETLICKESDVIT